ncbi:MAG: hypothetical protein HDS25_05620 [Bacteroides sp.]|nr:hypothetical protein [Bacteroides sp.]
MNFFKIRIPGQPPTAGCSDLLVEDVDTPDTPGFIYSEFEENPCIYLIPTDRTSLSDEEVSRWSHENDLQSEMYMPFIKESTPKEIHLSVIKQLREATTRWISSRYPHTKAIASRTLRTVCRLSPSVIFNLLCEKYPSACVFLFSTRRHGTWIGATPEIILTSEVGRLLSVSLAGTRPASCRHESRREWDLKNIEEQAIVTDFITSTFKAYGLIPMTKGPDTKKAGPVEHLYTEICAEGICKNFLLLKSLCPTPALSGFPREAAIEAIRNSERDPRQCYGGLIGIVREDGSFSTFANLRSGRLDTPKQQIELHAGGGITPLSDAEKEWEETEIKLSTLQKIIVFR